MRGYADGILVRRNMKSVIFSKEKEPRDSFEVKVKNRQDEISSIKMRV